MRKIKFRQWLSDRKRMFYTIGATREGEWTGPPKVTWSKYPLMQFTGLLDKNGKEIWEGDIVKYKVRNKIYIKPIAWATVGFWIVGDPYRLNDPKHWQIEVIGNIYENGDLLN